LLSPKPWLTCEFKTLATALVNRLLTSLSSLMKRTFTNVLISSTARQLGHVLLCSLSHFLKHFEQQNLLQ
jgi:hypothetical protein